MATRAVDDARAASIANIGRFLEVTSPELPSGSLEGIIISDFPLVLFLVILFPKLVGCTVEQRGLLGI